MIAVQPITEVRVGPETFDLSRLYGRLRSDGAACGAIVTFTGLVRELPQAELRAMFLEHYPGMTEKALHRIVEQARERWDLGAVIVQHRIGRLAPAEEIVFVGVASAHRREAFEAAQFIMDYLKRDAPFWKKEVLPDGEHWVAQKESDISAAGAWDAGERAGGQ